MRTLDFARMVDALDGHTPHPMSAEFTKDDLRAALIVARDGQKIAVWLIEEAERRMAIEALENVECERCDTQEFECICGALPE